MRKNIVNVGLMLGLGLLTAAPAFAAKPHHRAAATSTAKSSTAKTPVAQAPAGEAKPAEGTAPEAGAKKTPTSRAKKSHKPKKAAAATGGEAGSK